MSPERLTARDRDGRAIQCAVSSRGRHFHADEIWEKLAAYEDVGSPEEFAELKRAKEEGRLLELPTALGGHVFITGEYEETDGTVVRCIEETNLAGYIDEDGRPFYLCYSAEYGSCDVEMDNLFLTREAAEAAMKKEETHET